MTDREIRRNANKGFVIYMVGGIFTVLWVIAALPLISCYSGIGSLGYYDDGNFVAYGHVLTSHQFDYYFFGILFSIPVAKLGHLLLNLGGNKIDDAEKERRKRNLCI